MTPPNGDDHVTAEEWARGWRYSRKQWREMLQAVADGASLRRAAEIHGTTPERVRQGVGKIVRVTTMSASERGREAAGERMCRRFGIDQDLIRALQARFPQYRSR